MAELLNLKEWLTLPKAAERLSSKFNEDVSEADLLRLALDGHLKLSVDFVNYARAKCGKVVPLEQAKSSIWSKKEGALPRPVDGLSEDEITKGLDDGSLFRMIDGDVIRDNEVLELDDEICTLKGVYDLPMIGAEQLDVEHRFQHLTDGPAVTLVCLGGPLVEDHNGQLYQVQEHFSNNEYYKDENLAKPYDNPRNYYPAVGLPSDGVLVVRTSALRAFEQQHFSPSTDESRDANDTSEGRLPLHTEAKSPPLEQFRSMENLRFSEITIKVDPENNALRVAARGKQTIVPFSALGLTKQNQITPNAQGKLFFKIADGGTLSDSDNRALQRLSQALRDAFDTKDSPYNKGRQSFRFTVPKDRAAEAKGRWRPRQYDDSLSQKGDRTSNEYFSKNDPDYDPHDPKYSGLDIDDYN